MPVQVRPPAPLPIETAKYEEAEKIPKLSGRIENMALAFRGLGAEE